MKEAVDGIASVVEQLNERVRRLESRVSALEALPEKSSSTLPVLVSLAKGEPQEPSLAEPILIGSAPERPRPPATWRGFPPPDTPSGAVPVLGKAILGIAGAYLLRAIAESGALPTLPVLIVAIAYAGVWMVWAVRTHVANGFASVTYGITSILILSLLLWESTVRFQILSPVFTGLVLVAFLVLTFALTWRLDLKMIPWLAMLAAVNTTLALIIATHELVPLTATLLAVALLAETVASLGHQLTLRAVPAIAVDLAILLLVDLMTSAEGAPEGYPPAAPATLAALCLALLAIYGGGVAIRSFWLRRQITIFEIGQGVLAFVLATLGSIRATRGSATPVLGIFYMLLSAACYSGALSRFAEESHTRNRRVAATSAAALLLAGSLLLFPVNFQIVFLCVTAVAAASVYTCTAQVSFGLHASLFLAAAAALSSLPKYAIGTLAGSVPAAPDWHVWTVAVAAVLCYAVELRGPTNQSSRRMLGVVPAVLVSSAGAALTVAAIVWLASGRLELTAARLSVIRTIVICALAVTLGFLGSHWKCVELGWLSYTAVAFGTVKLLFEDLRLGNAASLVVSLLFYGLILIFLPRLMQRSRSESS